MIDIFSLLSLRKVFNFIRSLGLAKAKPFFILTKSKIPSMFSFAERIFHSTTIFNKSNKIKIFLSATKKNLLHSPLSIFNYIIKLKIFCSKAEENPMFTVNCPMSSILCPLSSVNWPMKKFTKKGGLEFFCFFCYY